MLFCCVFLIVTKIYDLLQDAKGLISSGSVWAESFSNMSGTHVREWHTLCFVFPNSTHTHTVHSEVYEWAVKAGSSIHHLPTVVSIVFSQPEVSRFTVSTVFLCVSRDMRLLASNTPTGATLLHFSAVRGHVLPGVMSGLAFTWSYLGGYTVVVKQPCWRLDWLSY